MPRIARRIAALLVLAFALLGARALAQTSNVYPTGLARANVGGGLYPGTDPGNCCWMSPTAELRLTPPRGADTLLLNLYLPPFAAYPGGELLRVHVNDAPASVSCCLQPGEHEIAVRLPSRGLPNVVVRIVAEKSFVPKERGINDDPRRLSMLLRGVAFLDARSGERFDPAPAPWLAARAALALQACIALAILLLVLRRPAFGFVALVLSDPFSLAAYVHGTTITLPKVALVAAAIGLLPHVLRARPRGSRALTALALAQGFAILSALASLPLAAQHGPAIRELLKACEYLATLGIAYASYALDPDEGLARTALTLVAFATLLPAFAQERIGTPQAELIAGHAVPRIAGPLEGPNQLAGFLGIVIPALAAFAVRRPASLFERLAIVLGVAGCALTFSRGGFASLVIALALLAIVAARPHRARAAALTVATIFGGATLVAFAAFAGFEPARALFAAHGDRFNGGLGSRSELWSAAYAMWRAHPLLGIGPGNFEIAVGRYVPGIRTHANGTFFQVLAEQGLIGLAAYASLLVAAIGSFVRGLRSPLALGACMASVALAFHQIVDCIAIYPKVGVMWFVLLGVAAAATTYTSDDTRDTTSPDSPDGARNSSAGGRLTPA